jgi:phosphohistidine phosphatase
MRLYIIRHAEAGQHDESRWPDDSQRPVTKEGQKRFEKLARLLADAGMQAELIVTSPYVRCVQTAETLSEVLGGQIRYVERSELEPNSNLDSLIRWTNEQLVETVAWVGHAPDVENITAALIGSAGAGFHFSKGAVAQVHFDEKILRAHGELRLLVSPKILD